MSGEGHAAVRVNNADRRKPKGGFLLPGLLVRLLFGVIIHAV